MAGSLSGPLPCRLAPALKAPARLLFEPQQRNMVDCLFHCGCPFSALQPCTTLGLASPFAPALPRVTSVVRPFGAPRPAAATSFPAPRHSRCNRRSRTTTPASTLRRGGRYPGIPITTMKQVCPVRPSRPLPPGLPRLSTLSPHEAVFASFYAVGQRGSEDGTGDSCALSAPPRDLEPY